jgi:hypothetical protein
MPATTIQLGRRFSTEDLPQRASLASFVISEAKIPRRYHVLFPASTLNVDQPTALLALSTSGESVLPTFE